jgi:hypothetical protein
MKRIRAVTLVAIAALGALAAFFLAGAAGPPAIVAGDPTGALTPTTRPAAALAQATGQAEGISVTGVGRVAVTPDLAVLRLGVEAQAGTVSEAREQAARAMQAVVDALRAAGVGDKDIQTQYFNIQPIYHWETNRQVLDGYRVSNRVVAKIRDLPRVGPAIDGAVKAGGDLTRIDSISFMREDTSAAEAEARKLATQNAVLHAKQISEAAGIHLGKAIYLSEGSSGYPIPIIQTFAGAARAPSETPTPILIGELEVVITVQAVFGIQ